MGEHVTDEPPAGTPSAVDRIPRPTAADASEGATQAGAIRSSGPVLLTTIGEGMVAGPAQIEQINVRLGHGAPPPGQGTNHAQGRAHAGPGRRSPASGADGPCPWLPARYRALLASRSPGSTASAAGADRRAACACRASAVGTTRVSRAPSTARAVST